VSEAPTQYDGLNLPQLLDLMHGIVVPEPVFWMPQTAGWWVLSGWLVAVCLLGLIKWLRRHRRNQYRRDSLEMLGRIDTGDADAAAQVAVIVKRTALAVYAREEVASLTGSEWAEFLARTADGDALVADSAPLIARAAYHVDVSAADIVAPARRWVKVHRA